MSNVFTTLIESFKQIGVARAYGDPVRIGGVELIPVALVSFGFGGGTEDKGEDHGADGGGGGGMVIPLGAYRLDAGGKAVFRPNTLAVLLCSVPVLLAAGRAAGTIVQALRGGADVSPVRRR